MAFPVILVNSATGSDSAASGAGPATALTGTTALTDAGGTTVTLDAGTVLTGVATDGSAAIWINDTTAGHRNFASITASSGSGGATPQVTVTPAVTGLVSGLTWAIGGVRASIGSATSALLFNNNGSAGDAVAGWTVEMQSAHAETLSASLEFQRAGNTDFGPIILRGTSGAATTPLLTFSNNGRAIQPNSYCQCRDFAMQNSNGTKTSSTAFTGYDVNPLGGVVIQRILIADPTNFFYTGIGPELGNGWFLDACTIGSGTYGIVMNGSQQSKVIVTDLYIHDTTSDGVKVDLYQGMLSLTDVLITNAGGSGLHVVTNPPSALFLDAVTIYNSTGDGIKVDSGQVGAMVVQNVILSTNGGYGINLVTVPIFTATATFRNCDTFNNTSGASNPSGIIQSGQTLDPQFTNAGAGDFSIGTNLKAKGYPASLGVPVGTTPTYVDIGAAQRQETGGGGGSSIGAQISEDNRP